jgi:4-amino-4-deoxy-L-arabinose transferase-like glycosyltransferase
MRGLTWVSVALVVALFCAPLFRGLGNTDFQGDEPIYSFAVDLILKTGDWLTPRSIPDEAAPFLEKPPLKFWIVAASVRSGWLAADEFGYRFWDAVFGAAAFLYVFALGVRLRGPVCGFIAVCTLFLHGPLLFEHGLRSNNMEAALLLGYCGGVYHALAWSTASGRLARRLHAQAVAAFFVLGFMTKFVAAFFLPGILMLTAAMFPHWRRRLLEDWRAWAAALMLIIVATVPWFAYQTIAQGTAFWHVILGEHVYKRMTGFLDPGHLQPWDYYFEAVYARLVSSRMVWPVLLGTGVLVFDTVRRRWDAGTLLLLWFAVPFVAMSFGTSKLYHYTYPFLPPLALGAGYICALLVRRDSPVPQGSEDAEDRLMPGSWLPLLRQRMPNLHRLAAGAAMMAFVVAAVTLLYGPFGISIGDVPLFRNSSIGQPLAIGSLLLLLTEWGRRVRQLLGIIVVLAVLPVNAYRGTTERLDDKDEPLQVLRRCLQAQSGSSAPPGFHVHAEETIPWRYVYYFRNLGWRHPKEKDDGVLAARLMVPAEQQPVHLTVDD